MIDPKYLLSAGISISLAMNAPSFAKDALQNLPAPPRTQFDISKDSPDMDWWREATKTREQRLAWWRSARFGMFVHWNASSMLGGVWQGKVYRGYTEHIQRQAQIPCAVYREEVVSQFNPTEFDADTWIRLAKQAGMRYFIITAKHHDGFAMYDSDASDYNIVDATPFRRDPMKELKAACVRHGIRFGFYYSHAFDWGEPNAPGNDWEFDNPGGDRLLHGGKMWYDENPQLIPKYRTYVEQKAIPQVVELIEKYDPDILWFDTAHKLPPEENIRVLQAVRQAKPDIVVNSRCVQYTRNGYYGDYQSTVDRPADFFPVAGDWEGIPTTNESYGWSANDLSHKPASFFIRLLAKAVARGGNVLMNIGPMGNGLIDPKDVEILAAIGKWMDVNAESIRDAQRTPLPVQPWGESTLKGNRLYLHVFDWPTGGVLEVGGLQSPVSSAWLLSDPKQGNLAVDRTDANTVKLRVPTKCPDTINSVVVVELKHLDEAAPVRLLSAKFHDNVLRTFDGELIGKGLRYGGGKSHENCILNWTQLDESIAWPVYLIEPAELAVEVEYYAKKGKHSGDFMLQIGEHALKASVDASNTQSEKEPASWTTHSLGRINLAPGEYTLRLVPADITAGKELMRPRQVRLSPVQ